jgi:metallo-beta-lactamase class B
MKSRDLLAAVSAMSLFAAGAPAQQNMNVPILKKDSEAPFPGFKVVGNMYYVGTYEIGSYLIDTGAGLILINSGARGSYPVIKANIEALGFKTADIKTIAATYGRWDHVGDLALFQKDAPTVKTYIDERDARLVESGGKLADPGPPGILYDPVKVDVKTKPGDHIKLGNTDITVLQAYGHAPGANSFSFMVQDGARKHSVFIINATQALVDGLLMQQRVKLPPTHEEWSRPFPGFKIVGNMYYVGTYDIGCYLIDTGAGLILVNSGAPGAYALIKANIEALGFKTSAIKIITVMHGHWDHVADLPLFQKDAPGAKIYVSERDARVVESGGNLDFRGASGILYDPVKVDVKINPGDHIKLGNTDITVLQAYGHTPGAVSFNLTVQDGGRKYNVFMVNMDAFNRGGMGINPAERLFDPPSYPTIVEDFKTTLAMQATYKPDIWVSTHADHFNLHEVYKPGDPYNPSRFGDLAAYKKKIAEYQADFDKELALERAAAK